MGPPNPRSLKVMGLCWMDGVYRHVFFNDVIVLVIFQSVLNKHTFFRDIFVGLHVSFRRCKRVLQIHMIP